MSKPYTSHDDIVRVEVLHKQGLKASEISQQTGVKRRTVCNLINRLKKAGGTSIPPHKYGGGNKKKIDERLLRRIKKQVNENPTLTAKLIKEENPKELGETSVRCIQETLHKEGYRKVAARKKPLLTKKQRRARRNFARNYRDWGLNEWREVLWSDEATFFVSDSKGKRVWRAPGADPLTENLISANVKYPSYLMVWGSFGYGGKGDLVILPRNETVNKEVYYTLLNLHLESSFESSKTSIFQQDGAPAHTARLLKEWFADASIDVIQDWPGNSPDISPIENLWAIMKSRMRNLDTSSLPKLEDAIRKTWDELDDAHLRNLADSVPKRLRKVLARGRKSDVTKY